MVLGLEIDEVQAAGEACEVSASIRGVDVGGDLSRAQAWASATPVPVSGEPCGEPVLVRLEWDVETASLRGWLPGGEPGLVEITVGARGVPLAGNLRADQTVEFVDVADLD